MSDPAGRAPAVQRVWHAWEQELLAEVATDRATTGQALADRVERMLHRREALQQQMAAGQPAAHGSSSGEFHFSDWISPDNYERLNRNPRLDVMIVKPNEWVSAIFNKKQGPFTSKALRQAVVAVLDMEPIMKAAVGAPEFYRLDPSQNFREQVWSDAARLQPPDREKAKRLMREAGYKGEPIRWMATQFYDWMYKSALAAKQQLEDVGFNIDLQVLEWATVVQRRNDPKLYEVFTTGIGFQTDPSQLPILSCDWPGWTCDSKLDALQSRLACETDLARRKAVWEEIQRWFWDEVPVAKLGDFFTPDQAKKRRRCEPLPHFFWNVGLKAWAAECGPRARPARGLPRQASASPGPPDGRDRSVSARGGPSSHARIAVSS
jgi:peptide/nickel transport system substrate-binding protein